MWRLARSLRDIATEVAQCRCAGEETFQSPDAPNSNDVPAALSLLDDQVEWTVAERFPYYSGAWKGPQAVLDNLLKPLSGD